MARNRLQIYRGPRGERRSTASSPTLAPRETVTLPVGDIVPWLADAVCRKRTWLEDFEDDEITVSRDLYEVIVAYQHYQRPSA